MDYQAQLAQYRAEFSQREEKEKPGNEQDPTEVPAAVWADEIQMPTPDGQVPLDPALMSGDIEMPQILVERDDRWTDDPEANMAAYQQFMENDPMFQQYGPEMEAILAEVMEQLEDPDNPLTEEEAVQVFLELMEEKFGQYFQ